MFEAWMFPEIEFHLYISLYSKLNHWKEYCYSSDAKKKYLSIIGKFTN
jgi:hypothetical protein